MGFGTIKRRKTDIEYSKYLREKRGNKCERCLRFFSKGKGLEVSHFWGRKAENTRFDEVNTDVLCTGCHLQLGENPGDYTEWKKGRMTETMYKALDVAAHTYKKRDDTADLLYIREIVKDLHP